VSDAFTTPSPTAVWTVNLRTCDKKYNDWADAKDPVVTFNYDLMNPPTSPVIATYTYLGAPVGVCGAPTATLSISDGT
jgi:hypothetical protein